MYCVHLVQCFVVRAQLFFKLQYILTNKTDSTREYCKCYDSLLLSIYFTIFLENIPTRLHPSDHVLVHPLSHFLVQHVHLFSQFPLKT